MGRHEQLTLIDRALKQASHGKPQYVFITGERGIGKSSLARMAVDIAEKKYNFVGAHAMVGSAETLGEFCRLLYQELVRQLTDKPLLDKLKTLFAKVIDKVELFGVGIEFRKDVETRQALAENFLPLLREVRRLAEESGRKGIILVADDLNGVARDPKLAHFLKSMVDQISVTDKGDFPWLFVLVGVPERMDDLRANQPSVVRIFSWIELPPLESQQAAEFYRNAFRSINHTFDDEAIDNMAEVAGGAPVIWHELGDAVYWADVDGHIGWLDVSSGMIAAMENVGHKYLQRPLYDELKSDAYRVILVYLGGMNALTFRRAELLERLPQDVGKRLDSFLQKMKEMDVLTPGQKPGEYAFKNHLFRFYIALRSSNKIIVG